MGAKSSKLKQPTSVVPGATSEDPPLPIEPVVFRKDNADAYDKPSLQPQDPQDPHAPVEAIGGIGRAWGLAWARVCA